MCALIVRFHYLICTRCVFAAVRLKKASPEEEAIKGMEIQPLIIQSWKYDQGEVSCSCSWKSDLSTEKPGREHSSAAASSPSIHRLISNQSGRGGRREQKQKGREGYFYFSPFPSAPPFLHTFFSGRVEIQEIWTKYFSYLKLLHYAFFQNVAKAFLSKGDEIPLLIAL